MNENRSEYNHGCHNKENLVGVPAPMIYLVFAIFLIFGLATIGRFERRSYSRAYYREDFDRSRMVLLVVVVTGLMITALAIVYSHEYPQSIFFKQLKDTNKEDTDMARRLYQLSTSLFVVNEIGVPDITHLREDLSPHDQKDLLEFVQKSAHFSDLKNTDPERFDRVFLRLMEQEQAEVSKKLIAGASKTNNPGPVIKAAAGQIQKVALHKGDTHDLMSPAAGAAHARQNHNPQSQDLQKLLSSFR